MTARDHTSYQEEIGAYLLGALTDRERQAFERHLANCPECRNEIEQLRPAADALPRSVEQVQPPPSLKESLMAVVDREAREAAPEVAQAPPRRSLRERFRLSPLRAGLALGALMLGLVAGFAQFGGGLKGASLGTIACQPLLGRYPDRAAHQCRDEELIAGALCPRMGECGIAQEGDLHLL